MGIDIVLRLIFICVVFFSLSACYSKDEYKDISDQAEYSGLVGDRFETLVPLVVHGVTLERNYGKAIDEFVVTVKPGFGGPEVLMRKTLPEGSIVVIEKILQCSTCVPSYVEFEVNLLSENLDTGIPVRLDDLSTKDNNGRVLLSPKLFRKIK